MRSTLSPKGARAEECGDRERPTNVETPGKGAAAGHQPMARSYFEDERAADAAIELRHQVCVVQTEIKFIKGTRLP